MVCIYRDGYYLGEFEYWRAIRTLREGEDTGRATVYSGDGSFRFLFRGSPRNAAAFIEDTVSSLV